MKWRNIKKIPPDKSVLLRYADGIVIEGQWSSELKEWWPIRLNSHGCSCCASDNPEVTHWMPKPKEPSE